MAVPSPTNGLDLSSIISGYGGAGVTSSEPQVYTGVQGGGTGEHSGPGKATPNGTVNLSTAQTMFAGFAPAEQQAMANKLYRAGILDDPNDIQGAYAQWQRAVQFAADAYTAGGKELTPWDVIQQQIGMGNAALKKKMNAPDQTHIQNNMLAPGDADAMIRSMYQNELGRDPSKGELSRYRSMLINKVRSHPDVSVTHNTYDAQGNVISSTNTPTQVGLSSAALQDGLQGDVQADPEYAAYQGATTYFNAIQGLFSGSPDLTGSNG